MKGDLFNYVKESGIIKGNLAPIIGQFLIEFINSSYCLYTAWIRDQYYNI